VKIVNDYSLRTRLTAYQKKIKEFENLFYPLFILLKKVKWISIKQISQKKYLLGINANLPALFSWNYHYIYYLVDEIYGISKDQIIFIDETYRKEIPREFEAHGFAYMNFLHKRVVISFKFFKQIVLNFIPAWIRCVVHALSDERHIIKTSRLILTDYIRWNLLMDTVVIKNHVTILLPDTTSKNLIFTRQGIKTWYIYPDNYTADYHTGWDEKIQIPMVYSFMSADFAVIFGNKIKRYFSYNRNTIKEYKPIGVLTAQRIEEIRNGKVPSRLRSRIIESNLRHPIIGIFDTTFADHGPLKIRHGLQFGNDLIRLLDDFPDIHIIFKEKKNISITPELAPVYEKLEKHPRCLVVRKTEQDCLFSSDVIAMSNFVISAAYTSTTAEALASKTRAVYYDVAGTDIGDQYYFNRFPNFVAHDYDELKKLVHYWLYESTPEDFDNFLTTYVKDEIDPYLDMKAISRLHQMFKTE
jgi:polysaccharide biosynthesis PFTS motif protein